MNPKISIIMSVYNDANNVSETIESALNQTFSDFEFIIIDDGSIDKTYHVLKLIQKKDKRIILLKNSTNVGLTKSLNKGIKISKGNWVARIDSGDLWEKEKLEKQIDFLKKNPDTILLGTQAKIIDENYKIIRKTNYPTNDKNIRLSFLKGQNPFMHSSVIFKNGYYYNNKVKNTQDFELWCRLYFKGKLANLKQNLVKYQISFSSISYKNKMNQIMYNILIYNNFIKKIRNKKINTEIPEKVCSKQIFTYLYKKAYQLKPKLPYLYKILVFIAYISSPILFLKQLKHKFFVSVNFYRYKDLIK